MLQQKNEKKALYHAKKAYQLNSRDPAILDTYGWVLSENGDSILGLRYIRQALSRSSSDPAANYHLALVLSRLERKDEAISTLRELLKNKQTFRDIQKARTLLTQLENS